MTSQPPAQPSCVDCVYGAPSHHPSGQVQAAVGSLRRTTPEGQTWARVLCRYHFAERVAQIRRERRYPLAPFQVLRGRSPKH
jgi:hypothetical protein